jgi:hypothetical protein
MNQRRNIRELPHKVSERLVDVIDVDTTGHIEYPFARLGAVLRKRPGFATRPHL